MSFNAEYVNGRVRSDGKFSLNQIFKRVFDLSFATLGFVLLSPLFCLVAVSVLILDGRPIFFKHKRITANGKYFYCLKFRSMVRDADRILSGYLSENRAAAAQWAEKQKLVRDPRITALGGFLRRSSLDELPQLLNVIRGEMSLVGPRPIVADELARYGAFAEDYLSVRPGLTGPWQISGRSNCSYAERIRLDQDYIQNWTFLRDLRIIGKTFIVVFSGRGSC